MRKQAYTIGAVLLFQVVNTLAVEEVVETGVKGYVVLFFRAIIALILSVSFGIYRKETFIPNRLRVQGVRLFTSGLSLILIFQSFSYLSATSVSLIQRMDIPLVIFTGVFFRGINKASKYVLSIISCVIVLLLIFFSKTLDEDPIGYLLCLAGVVLVSISYHFVKKTVEHENNTILLNTTCLSCILFTSILGYFYGFQTSFSLIQVIYIVITGVSMFCMYQLLAGLYRKYNPETAQYPALISVFIILVSEMFIEHKIFSLMFIAGNLLLLVTISAISFYDSIPRSLMIWRRRGMPD